MANDTQMYVDAIPMDSIALALVTRKYRDPKPSRDADVTGVPERLSTASSACSPPNAATPAILTSVAANAPRSPALTST